MRIGRTTWGFLAATVALIVLAAVPWVGGTATCTDPAAGGGECSADGPFMGPVGTAAWSVACMIAAAATAWRAFAGPRR